MSVGVGECTVYNCPFTMVMEVMIVIMMMRIIMKTMNSSSYRRVLSIIATK